MPNINIKEDYESTISQLGETDSVVLVPLLYARKYDTSSEGVVDYSEDKILPGILYEKASVFNSEMRKKCVTVDGKIDKTFTMVHELLSQGLKVVVKPVCYENASIGTNLTFSRAFELLENAICSEYLLEEFKSKNIFNIKFITSGAYPNCGVVISESSEGGSPIYKELRNIAVARGDAIYLREYPESILKLPRSEFISSIKDVGFESDDKYGAGFIGWSHYKVVNLDTNKEEDCVLPGCFGYLMAFANSIKSNADWFAAAGVIRGEIPNFVSPVLEIDEALMNILQGEGQTSGGSLNCIYKVSQDTYRIWGNRTLYLSQDNLYSDYLNVRILLCDIKKQIYAAAMRTTFEPNDDIVWLNFKSLANTLLDKMKSGRGIKWYSWTKDSATKKATIKATLTVRPIEAVESFDINIYLTSSEAELSDNA